MTLDKYMKDTKNCLFLGMPVRQYHADLWLWEKFLATTPIKAMVELGTGGGGMSLFFMMQGIQHGFNFMTFDLAVPSISDEPIQSYFDLERCFVLCDIFDEGKPMVVNKLRASEHPLLLYCDDGDKRREVQEFGAHLLPGDYVAVHDFGTEFTAADIQVKRYKLMLTEECAAIGSRTRWFRVKS